jgi:hypothetical protein
MIIRSVIKPEQLLFELLKHFEHAWGEKDTVENKQILGNFKSTHIDRLTNCKSVLIQSPYVDKVYRDSYYHYFASKHAAYNKNAIRISFFNIELSEADFTTSLNLEKIENSYLGFIILRPTFPQIVGRSTINPIAINEDILSCTAMVNATAGGIKLKAKGFPHSSQDSESISCAETTLWSLFEYYSSKYQEYRPILPSDIIRVLAKSSSVRQLPSSGLDITKMAFAIKEFGFAPMLYGEKAFKKDFYRLISTYIESGIPLVAGLLSKDKSIGHAILITGRKRITNSQIDNLQQSGLAGVNHFDFHDIQPEFIILDDNLPCYSEAPISKPCNAYPDPIWQSARITHIIAPLYIRMYLEAEVAKFYFQNWVFTALGIQAIYHEIVTRFFMTSSRSYKHYLISDAEIDADLVDVLIRIEMPKFIWVGELSSKELLKQQKCNGLVVLDATEANRSSTPMLFTLLTNQAHLKLNNKDIQSFSLDLPPFRMFDNNLKV